MGQLVWGATGERVYEAGTDRGVLYVNDMGVAWSGLKAVKESPSGGDPKPLYIDGVKYLNLAEAEEFAATIEAFSAPPEFAVCDGTGQVYAGLFITQQPRKPFGLSYRTQVGNDVEGLDLGYKIHVVYNALASPSNRDNTTLNSSADPLALSWGITTTPPPISGFKPSAHFVIDSRHTPDIVLAQLESILYGSQFNDPYLPTVPQLINLFNGFIPFRIYELEEGVYYINETSPQDSRAIMSSDTPLPLENGDPLLWLDTSNEGYAIPKLITGE